LRLLSPVSDILPARAGSTGVRGSDMTSRFMFISALLAVSFASAKPKERDDPFTLVGSSRSLGDKEIETHRIKDPKQHQALVTDSVDRLIAAKRLTEAERAAAVAERTNGWTSWEFGAGTSAHQVIAAPKATKLDVHEGKNAAGQTAWDVHVVVDAAPAAEKEKGDKSAKPAWHLYAFGPFTKWLGNAKDCPGGSYFVGNYTYRASILSNIAGYEGCSHARCDYGAAQIEALITSECGGLQRGWTQIHPFGSKFNQVTKVGVVKMAEANPSTGVCETVSAELKFGVSSPTGENLPVISSEFSSGKSFQVCYAEQEGPIAVQPQYPKDGALQWISPHVPLDDKTSRIYRGALITSLPSPMGTPAYDFGTYTGFWRQPN
jgi:hypothetical protein